MFLVDCNKKLSFSFFFFTVTEHSFLWENITLNNFLCILKLDICIIKSKEAIFLGVIPLYLQ